jgi:hypothetical protein
MSFLPHKPSCASRRHRCLAPSRLEQLDQISRRIFSQNLLSTNASHDVVTERDAPLTQLLDRGIEVDKSASMAEPAGFQTRLVS